MKVESQLYGPKVSPHPRPPFSSSSFPIISLHLAQTRSHSPWGAGERWCVSLLERCIPVMGARGGCREHT